MNVMEETKKKMEAAIDHFKDELKNIRTGRASPSMVDQVTVEIYGSQMRLKDVASISTPEPRMLLITPFDPQNTNAIGKAIEKANLGFMPIVEANVVRINIPPMTEEIRKKMVKLCHELKEKAKISIRNIRREANERIKKLKNDGEIAEDRMKRLEKDIQEATDKYCKLTEEVAEKKEKEVSTI